MTPDSLDLPPDTKWLRENAPEAHNQDTTRKGRCAMNDRERVLLNIAVDVAGSVHDTMHRLAGGWQLRFTFDHPAEQFIPEEMASKIGMPMVPGDIVRCCTNPNHAWGISELVEKTGHSECLLREIGGAKTLRMGNESFDVLRFMRPHRLYVGAKFKIYKWVTEKAFSERYNPDADYFKRCGGIVFEGDILTIWCRPHIFAMEKKDGAGITTYAQPKRFALKWNVQTKLKDILAAMRAQGFGGEFEYSSNKPDEGMGGFTSLTREDLLRHIAGLTSAPGAS